MYAIIRSGGKQYRVAQGDVVSVERDALSGADKEKKKAVDRKPVKDSAEAKRLADHLRALRAGVACEIGYVQAQRCPVTDRGGQRAGKHSPECVVLFL